jgi:hypothetical protein
MGEGARPALFLAIPIVLLCLSSSATAEPLPDRARDAVHDATAPCPRSDTGDIVVCAKRPSERYRLPETLRSTRWSPYSMNVESVYRERNRLMEPGASGTGSCSATGAGGWTGCLTNEWHRKDQQRAGYTKDQRHAD